ncbi:MAG: biotin/lipoyl-containing protein [Myxococcota bacterium]|nr:biotin/lipoyl-containing protein [Myxococcota bacterium]
MPWMLVEFEGTVHRVPVAQSAKGVWVGWPGGSTLCVRDELFAGGGVAKGDNVLAPMTGKVIEVKARVGEAVSKDELLVVLEAMKMEYRLVAPRDGVVEGVHCSGDELVDLGKVLVSLGES